MTTKTFRILFLISSIILAFIVGFWLELDYRILTRKAIKFFLDNKIDFYPRKDWRFFETDIAFILTLVPIIFFAITRKIISVKEKLFLGFLFPVLLIIFYFFFCFIESKYILTTIVDENIQDGILKYHQNNINYKTILLATVISTFINVIIIKRNLRRMPVANKY